MTLPTGSNTYGQPMRTFNVALHEEHWRRIGDVVDMLVATVALGGE